MQQKWNQEPTEFDLKELAGYMLLEFTGDLAKLQKMNKLNCVFKPSVNNPLAVIELGLQYNLDTAISDDLYFNAYDRMCAEFTKIVSLIPKKITGSLKDNSITLIRKFSVSMSHEELNKIIMSSSLYKATHDFKHCDSYELIRIKENLALYKISGPKFTQLLDGLTTKITNLLTTKHKDDYDLYLKISTEKIALDNAFESLQSKINELVAKGDKASSTFSENYVEVATTAQQLALRLDKARSDFFMNKPTAESLAKYKSEFEGAVNAARGEFAKFRGGIAFYYELYPALKMISIALRAIAGVVLGVTFIFAVPFMCTHQGFFGTFFQTNSNSIYDLNRYEDCGKQVFEHLEQLIQPG